MSEFIKKTLAKKIEVRSGFLQLAARQYQIEPTNPNAKILANATVEMLKILNQLTPTKQNES